MNLVVDHSGQQPRAVRIQHSFLAGAVMDGRHLFDPAISDQQVALCDVAFVYHAGVFDQYCIGHGYLAYQGTGS